MPLISLKRLAVLILFSPFLLAAGQDPDPMVWLPQDTNAIVDAATEGIISTDYSIEIRHEASGRKKTARAVLGAGAQRLTISSTKGDIRLFRQAA